MKHKDFFSYGKQAGMDRFTLPNNVTDLSYFLLEPVSSLYNPNCRQRIIEKAVKITYQFSNKIHSRVLNRSGITQERQNTKLK